MDIGIIAIVILGILGAICFFAPNACTRADMRDDPDAVAKVKKLGMSLMAGAIVAALLCLKYKLR